jgi:hypothetical protein
MPVVKKFDGWWWGSTHGPYLTKTKALQVGQAAHANGFKESEMENIIGEFVGTLMHSGTIVHFMHLQTKSYSVHKALQKYYENIVDLTDTIAEAIQGCTGQIINNYPSMFGNPAAEPLDYLISIRDYVIANRDAISEYSNIQNEIDAVMTLLDSTIYRLTFLK